MSVIAIVSQVSYDFDGRKYKANTHRKPVNKTYLSVKSPTKSA